MIYHEFQSTPLRKGRRHLVFEVFNITEFQSTPLRKGRLEYLLIAP